MAKCARGHVESMIGGGGGGGGNGFRLWPVFSAAAFRRKLLEAVVCGGTSRHRSEAGSTGDVRPLEPAEESKRTAGSGRLAELLKAEVLESAAEKSEGETKRKIEAFEELQRTVKRLQSEENGGGDSRKEAALEVRRLAKDDAEARKTLAMLGAIPPLAGMLDSGDPDLQIASLYALLNLGIGNDANKAAIVKGGSVHKMLNLIESGCSPSASEAVVANFLSLSALDSNKAVIGSTGAIAFLVETFRSSSNSKSEVRSDSLRSLFNLSISPSNIPHLVESGLVSCLLSAIGEMEVSERILSVLSNLIAAPEGRRAVSRSPESIPILIDVLNWSDSPECQEKAAYVLMVMAHKGYGDRTAMIEAGIASSLLELTLLGSVLAQKRASRILEILRVDKGKQVSEGFHGVGSGAPPVSAPVCGGSWEEEEEEEEEMRGMSEERKAVKQLVQQSLQSNMRRIVRRANLPQDFAPSDHFLTVAATSTKSLPF